MKKALIVTAAVCVLGAGGFAFAAGLATKSVNIRPAGFQPRTVTVNGGDTVVWRNTDTVNRQIVANNGSFASPILAPNRTYTRPMNTPGTYVYHDTFKPTQRGVVRVVGPAPSVAAGVSPPIVIAGSAVRISGAITPAGVDTVIVYAQPYPMVSWVEIGRLQTGTNGVFEFSHTPTILTSYKVAWRARESAVVRTAVAPRLSLVKIRSWFVVRARAAKSFSGRWVYVQRLNQFGQWVSLRKVFLNRQSTQRFKLPTLRTGVSRLRVFMTTNQAGAGYVFSSSSVLTVRRR
jgi:plastocyanin